MVPANAGIPEFEHLDGRAGKEGRMPLSDHEQRMLDQIESALYAEDPKFARASAVGLCAHRRRDAACRAPHSL